jgi:hypothetical protein
LWGGKSLSSATRIARVNFLPRLLRNLLRLHICLDPKIFVRARFIGPSGVPRSNVSEAVEIRLALIRCASIPVPSDFDEAERRKRSDGPSDAVAADAPLFEVEIGNWQLSVLSASVREMLDLYAIERPALSKAQGAHRCAFQQLPRMRDELPGNPGFLAA